jgi:dienelactone hydrolase
MHGVFQTFVSRTSGGRSNRDIKVVAGAAVVGLLTLGGCMSYRAADQGRAERAISGATMKDTDWPVRDKAEVQALKDATPQVYHQLELDGTKPLEEVLPRHRDLVVNPSMTVTFNDFVGQGLLRVVSEPNEPEPGHLTNPNDLHQGFHPNAWFLSSMTLNDSRWGLRMSNKHKARQKDEADSPQSGVRYSNADLDTAIKEGIPIGLPPIQTTPPRGLLIHFVAIMGNGYETAVMNALRDEGWAVIDIDSNPRLMGGGRTYDINDDRGLEVAADCLARRIDDVLAEHAYAAEAALEYCRKNRPDLPTGHVAMIGFSAGSLVVPTAAARLGDQIEAAVLIAGGANLLEIALDSALSDGGIHVNWGPGRGGSADKEKLLSSYLDHSRLDPYRTATTLANKPVLQYWGKWDKWVPAESGALLSKQLNNPDKVTFLGGHALLFYFLPTETDRIRGWIDNTMDSQTRLSRGMTTAPVAGPEAVKETVTR